MRSTPDPTPSQVRAVAAVLLVFELALLAWESRQELRIAAPALLLVHLVGLVGFGLYRSVVRWWRREVSHEEIFASSGLFAAVVTGGVTYAGGEWMGLHSALGSLVGGVTVGLTLVLARLAIWGPRDKVDDPSRDPR
jgi:uncharacterized membrane protein